MSALDNEDALLIQCSRSQLTAQNNDKTETGDQVLIDHLSAATNYNQSCCMLNNNNNNTTTSKEPKQEEEEIDETAGQHTPFRTNSAYILGNKTTNNDDEDDMDEDQDDGDPEVDDNSVRIITDHHHMQRLEKLQVVDGEKVKGELVSIRDVSQKMIRK